MVTYAKLTLDETLGIVDRLAEAEERNLRVSPDRPAEGYKAIWNRTDDCLAAVVSDKYALIQHRDFFDPFFRAVGEIGTPVREVRVHDERTRVYAEVVFDRTFVQEGILAGLRAGNSIDGTLAAFCETYALRLVCTNGLLGRELFGKVSRIHVGQISIKDLTRQIGVLVPVAEARARGILHTAQVDVMNGETGIRVLESLGFGKRLVEYVQQRIEPEISRYDFYNLVTTYIENRMKIRQETREEHHHRANVLLLEPSERLTALAARQTG